MIKLTLGAAALAVATLAPFSVASAQDDGIERLDNDWYQVTLVKYKPGTLRRAREIQREYFKKALDSSGVEGVMEVHINVGEWNTMTFWPLPNGPDQLSWVQRPDISAYYAALTQVAGGAEERSAILAEYTSLIADETSYVAHMHGD